VGLDGYPEQGQDEINRLQRGTNLAQTLTNLETEDRDVQTRKGVTALALVVGLIAVLGLAVGTFLFVRSNDMRGIDGRIATRVGQAEQMFCTFLERHVLNRDTVGDREISDQAVVLMREFDCKVKG
jgi:hypothetical protein